MKCNENVTFCCNGFLNEKWNMWNQNVTKCHKMWRKCNEMSQKWMLWKERVLWILKRKKKGSCIKLRSYKKCDVLCSTSKYAQPLQVASIENYMFGCVYIFSSRKECNENMFHYVIFTFYTTTYLLASHTVFWMFERRCTQRVMTASLYRRFVQKLNLSNQ